MVQPLAVVKADLLHPDEFVEVEPILMPESSLNDLESTMLMFFTGIVRSASPILREQSTNVSLDRSVRASTERLKKNGF